MFIYTDKENLYKDGKLLGNKKYFEEQMEFLNSPIGSTCETDKIYMPPRINIGGNKIKCLDISNKSLKESVNMNKYILSKSVDELLREYPEWFKVVDCSDIAEYYNAIQALKDSKFIFHEEEYVEVNENINYKHTTYSSAIILNKETKEVYIYVKGILKDESRLEILSVNMFLFNHKYISSDKSFEFHNKMDKDIGSITKYIAFMDNPDKDLSQYGFSKVCGDWCQFCDNSLRIERYDKIMKNNFKSFSIYGFKELREYVRQQLEI